MFTPEQLQADRRESHEKARRDQQAHLDSAREGGRIEGYIEGFSQSFADSALRLREETPGVLPTFTREQAQLVGCILAMQNVRRQTGLRGPELLQKPADELSQLAQQLKIKLRSENPFAQYACAFRDFSAWIKHQCENLPA